MGICKNCKDDTTVINCGMNNVTDFRCCYFCEYKHNCEGFCIVLESHGDFEEVAKNCKDFIE